MSRHVHNAGGFYATSPAAWRTAGTSASITALVAYNAMQTAIYGMFGFAVSSFLDAHTSIKACTGDSAVAASSDSRARRAEDRPQRQGPGLMLSWSA